MNARAIRVYNALPLALRPLALAAWDIAGCGQSVWRMLARACGRGLP